ncbi:FAD-dependent oxidoreductase domain-containing protein 1 isoform X2 [Orussus abietinus]|nr:FAD-dependent oxidoreductase domain-containing protein 1 isoform X2 [Orussus abietinus]
MPNHPLKKTVQLLKNELLYYKAKWKHILKRNLSKSEWRDLQRPFPYHCDVVIIGGGAIGSSIAYWLKKEAKDGLNVAVIERDPLYKHASSVLSVGGLRQQFSLPENIEMSLFGAEFIRNANEYLNVDKDDPLDLGFHPNGYLFLASEAGAEIMSRNSDLQNSLGANNILLKPDKLKQRFPWLNTDGIALGCLGLEQEGWFDPWMLLYGFKRKALDLGAHYVNGEAIGFEFNKISGNMIKVGTDTYEEPVKLKVKTECGTIKTITFATVIIAAGAFSAEVAKMARIGHDKGLLSIPLPVEPRKRFVYCFHCHNGPGLNTPLTVDPTGTYFRREGLQGNYICGRSPDLDEEPLTADLEVDHDFFRNKIWPPLANRVPAFENIKVKSSWAGFYEYNSFDENGIIGPHPYYGNMYIATGFSGHGIQQAPAVGRAISELLINSKFVTIDLSRLSFDRFVTLEPMEEVNIV